MSRFYICVRLSHYVLCLQRLLCIENVLFQSTRFSTHKTLRVKIGIWSQILKHYQIFHLFISRYEIFIRPISHVLCLYKPSFNLKILRAWLFEKFWFSSCSFLMCYAYKNFSYFAKGNIIWHTCYAGCENLHIIAKIVVLSYLSCFNIEIGIWSQILQYYQIFHLFISRFEIFIWPTSHVLCLYKPSFNLKIISVCEYYSTHVIVGVKNENWSQRLKLHILPSCICNWKI